MVYFVGAGPGAPDLITLRGRRLLETAEVVIFAGSLVNPRLLDCCKENCAIYDSSSMTLEEVVEVMKAAEEKKLVTVRLHTGDPSIFGAVREQMDRLSEEGIAYESCPGVSSFCGAAAAMNLEYTLPGIAQTVVISRTPGRTPMPQEGLICPKGASLVYFLSAQNVRYLVEELINAGICADTPAAVAYKVSWPEEAIYYCTVGTLSETVVKNGITKTALIIVGEALRCDGYERSNLYDPAFSTGYRKGFLE